jgi:hypothetical protein
VKARSESVRVAAIRELLDRGYGKPTQSFDGKFDQPALIVLSPDDAKLEAWPKTRALVGARLLGWKLLALRA